MRVVLDTNIIISGILSAGGASRALLDLARRGRMQVITSPMMLSELEEVLARFMSQAAATEIRTAVQEFSYLIDPTIVPPIARDPDDDHVLAAAITGRATHLVTRDHDLLDLQTYAGIRILEPAAALQAIRAEGEAGLNGQDA